MTISRRTPFLLFLGLSIALTTAATVYAQEESLKPGINESYKTLEIEKAVKRFEGSGRDVVQKKGEIVAACQLEKGMIVGDVGAGTGLFTRLMATKVLPKGKVYAVDVTEGFVEHVLKTCKEQGIENVTGIVCKPTSAELPPESVDLVFTCDTYHHFEYPFKMLASIRGALRSGGQLVVVDRKQASSHVRADQDTVAEEVTSAGFKLLDKSEPTARHYLMRFKKVD